MDSKIVLCVVSEKIRTIVLPFLYSLRFSVEDTLDNGFFLVKEKCWREKKGESLQKFIGTHVFYNYNMKDYSQCFHVCSLRMTVSHKPSNL